MSLMQTRWIKLKRTLREGFRNFHRDGWLSFATVTVLTLSLYIISVTFLLVMIGRFLMGTVQDNVNISAYFYPSAQESRILEVQKELELIKEIDEVTYVSRDQAFKDFKESTKDPALKQLLESYEKDGENPLYASLIIKATSPEHYQGIDTLLKTKKYKEDISEVNFPKVQVVVEKLSQIMVMVRTVGGTLGVIFIVIAIMMVYNTVRITMFARRQEFEIMRLVGASNLYARMPSLYEGLFYGVTSALTTLALLALTTYFLTPFAQDFLLRGTTLFAFYMHYFWEIATLTLAVGIILGIISSTIAIRRYLTK